MTLSAPYPRDLYASGMPDGALLDVAIAHALVRRASRGELGETVRIYRASGPTVAFGRVDVRRDGYAEAVSACRAAGFEPVVRAPGGRAVAYTGDAIVIDHVSAQRDPATGLQDRFAAYGERLAGVLRAFGVDARVGEVPGEYCPGAYSVNARGVVKLIGTAQRVVRGAWLFSSVVIVGGTAELRPVLTQTYDRLGLPFDPASVGSIRDEADGIDIDALDSALTEAYAGLVGDPDADTMALAWELAADHRAEPAG